MPTNDEFLNAIKNINENKSPGFDGITIEFYKRFWDLLKDHYMNMVLETKEMGSLPHSTKTSVLSLIHKGDSKDKLNNYRPLSLTNCDYKILATVFAERLQPIMTTLIHPDQVAYIKDRYIGCNIRNLIDLYEYVEKLNIPGALISIDFQKAFDSVEHNFLFAVLQKYNFGNSFSEWIKIFYNNPAFRAKNN
jgi:hypothetical protein